MSLNLSLKLLKNKQQKLAFAAFLAVAGLSLAIIFSTPGARSKNKSYYSGDAINYKNNLIIGSANMGQAEIFKLAGDRLTRISRINPPAAQFGSGSDFFNIAFSQENGRLYAYLVNGRYIFKYDLTSPDRPVLIDQEKDNSWDWLVGLYKNNGNIITIGSKGVKVWTPGLEVINAFNIIKDDYNNVQLSESGRNVFNIGKDVLENIDAITRKVTASSDLYLKNSHARHMFIDENKGEIYVADDKGVEKFNFSGKLLKSASFASGSGFDVAGTPGEAHVYATNGTSIMKIDRMTMRPIITVRAGIGGPNSWAMGLKVVRLGGREEVVVFNNSGILLLDNGLNKISSVVSTTKDDSPQEALFLNIDKNRAPGGSLVSLRGGGFMPGENLTIDFAGTKTQAAAGEDGRFVKVLQVPSVLPVKTDIKVSGQTSKLTYSLGFQIE